MEKLVEKILHKRFSEYIQGLNDNNLKMSI